MSTPVPSGHEVANTQLYTWKDTGRAGAKAPEADNNSYKGCSLLNSTGDAHSSSHFILAPEAIWHLWFSASGFQVQLIYGTRYRVYRFTGMLPAGHGPSTPFLFPAAQQWQAVGTSLNSFKQPRQLKRESTSRMKHQNFFDVGSMAWQRLDSEERLL